MAKQAGFRIETNTAQVRDLYGQFLTEIPEVERSIARKIAYAFAREVRRSIRHRGLAWHGNLLQSALPINAVHETAEGFQFRLDATSPRGVNYAAWHEFGETHQVYARPENAPLHQWARERGIAGARQGMHPRLTVTPTPFMKSPIQVISSRLRGLTEDRLEQELDRRLDFGGNRTGVRSLGVGAGVGRSG